ncbi:MAG TPA: F0F1 ATP synthase subunit delta [Verrucomicrobiae bacterium]|nr:F0F1 ATP synthase subunit delta [Verrucomicrobiae bacterium]
MKITKQARREAKQLFRATIVNGVMDEGKVRQVVQQVLEKKPRGFMAILELFKRSIKLEQDRRRATVESAIDLSADQQLVLRNSLTRLYGPGLNLTFQQNAKLLGGLRVRVGSDVYDGSVAARLQILEQTF